VLLDARQGHPEALRELADRGVLTADALEDAAAARSAYRAISVGTADASHHRPLASVAIVDRCTPATVLPVIT
jgi:hypothetical protein